MRAEHSQGFLVLFVEDIRDLVVDDELKPAL
jgi:hypothetical protein